MKTKFKYKIDDLTMYFVGFLGLLAFVLLAHFCWFITNLISIPEALRLVWLPRIPIFCLFLLIIFVGLKRKYSILNFAVILSFLLLINGIFALFGTSSLWQSMKTNLLFSEPILYGIVQILIFIILILAWILHYQTKNSNL
jgi:hypothetical protein